jgi:hypothetical protein
MPSNVTNFTDQPMELECANYTCYDDGIRYIGMRGEVLVCRHPIMPTKRIIDADTGNIKIEIAYNAGLRWQKLIVNRSTVASAQKIVDLSDRGIGVSSDNAFELVKYLMTLEQINRAILPTQKSAGHMGCVRDGESWEFVPYSSKIALNDNDLSLQQLKSGLTPRGTKEKWLNVVREIRTGDSLPARIALDAAFMAPCVKLTNSLNCMIHFCGKSGTGKTVALQVAASVWGEPLTEGGKLIKSLNSTKNALEATAANCGNLPVMMDELQMIKNQKDYDELIYSLTEGQGRGRATRTGSLQTSRSWQTVFITTGEAGILKQHSGTGAAARVIEVDGGERNYYKNAPATSASVKLNYGWAGPIWISILQQPGMIDRLNEYRDKYYADLVGKTVDKQAGSAALLLAVSRLVAEEVFHDECSLTVANILPYLVTIRDADINCRCLDWLRDTIVANSARFNDALEENRGEIWGKYDDNTCYIIRSVFDKLLTNAGYDSKTFLKWAREREEIISDDGRYTVKPRINGKLVWCVALRFPDDTAEAGTEPVVVSNPDEDLPF